MAHAQAKIPVLLMVSGGSDSTALLELVCAYAAGERSDEELFAMLADSLPAPDRIVPFVLHVNHMLRARIPMVTSASCASFARSSTYPARCSAWMSALSRARAGEGWRPSHVRNAIAWRPRHWIVLALGWAPRMGSSAPRIRLTIASRPSSCARSWERGRGLASIPRVRGNLRRPLLDATREQLRDWLRKRHPGVPDEELWREDETNLTGDNFRSQIRRELIPVLRELRPGFGGSLAQTMDLIADEDEALRCQADSIAYRTLVWDGETASMPVEALRSLDRSMARRVMRVCLLVVNPDARLEAAQIDRVLDGLEDEGFTTETSGGLRVSVFGDALVIRKVQ